MLHKLASDASYDVAGSGLGVYIHAGDDMIHPVEKTILWWCARSSWIDMRRCLSQRWCRRGTGRRYPLPHTTWTEDSSGKKSLLLSWWRERREKQATPGCCTHVSLRHQKNRGGLSVSREQINTMMGVQTEAAMSSKIGLSEAEGVSTVYTHQRELQQRELAVLVVF